MMFSAGNSNQQSVSCLHPMFSQFSDSIVADVKAFLLTRGYRIIEIEDFAGISNGWRLSWSSAARPSTSNPLGLKEGDQVTRDNFPTASQFQQFCEENTFNRFLNVLKQKILCAGSQSCIRVMVPEFSCFSGATVTEVKSFLVTQGFQLTDIEDSTGIPQGFKMSW
jgi:hypothetical protein